MFSKKYLKRRDIYYATDLLNLKNCYQISSNTKFFIHSNDSSFNGSKTYPILIKTALVSSQMWSGLSEFQGKRLGKVRVVGVRNKIFKRAVNDFVSVLLSGQNLLVDKLWSSSNGRCLDLKLKNLFLFPNLQHIFSRLSLDSKIFAKVSFYRLPGFHFEACFSKLSKSL